MKYIIIIVALLVSQAGYSQEEEVVEYISYKEFVSAVEKGKIDEVSFYTPAGIRGEIKRDNEIVNFDCYRSLSIHDDPLLQRFLLENGVEFNIVEKESNNRLGGGLSLFTMIWIIILISGTSLVFNFLLWRKVRRLVNKGEPVAGGDATR
jgi:ATP-dependent Zn protease